MLYIPAGWPHTTDTVNLDDDGDDAQTKDSVSSEDSVHLTVGLDTHIWGLNYAAARKGMLARAKEVDELKVTELEAEPHWRLMGVPQHLGFLSHHGGEGGAAAAAEAELVACVRAAEAARWEGSTDAELSARLGAPAVVERLEEHAQKIVEIQRALYLETARDNIAPSTAAPPMPGMPPGAKVSMFRVKPHMERLELAMEGLLGWFNIPSLLLVDPPPPPTGGGGGGGGGGGAARPKPAAAAAAADKGGFGGGGGMGGKAKKKPAKKKKR